MDEKSQEALKMKLILIFPFIVGLNFVQNDNFTAEYHFNKHTAMYSLQIRLFTLFFLVNFFACKESVDPRHKTIAGNWYIHRAEVDGTSTQRLDGTIFTFANGKIITNVPQIGEGTYTFDDDKIIQKGDPSISYTIEELSDTILILSMNFRDIPFRLEFGREENSLQN